MRLYMNNPSTAAQVIIAVIPITGIVMGSVVAILYLSLNYKAKCALIEKGQYKPAEFDVDAFCLFSGLLLMPIGLILVAFFLVKEGFNYGLLGGLIPFSVGLSMVLFFLLRSRMISKRNG